MVGDKNERDIKLGEERNEKKFTELLEDLRKQLLEASEHFEIWKELCPTAQNVGIINQYKGFFLLTRDAHIDRFYIKISNVLSNDKNAPSYYRVFNLIENAQYLKPDIDINALRQRLKPFKRILNGIHDYRRKKAAHWDTTQIEICEPVLVGDIQRLLTELQDVYNIICKQVINGEWSFTPLEHGDTAALLKNLNELRATKQIRR